MYKYFAPQHNSIVRLLFVFIIVLKTKENMYKTSVEKTFIIMIIDREKNCLLVYCRCLIIIPILTLSFCDHTVLLAGAEMLFAHLNGGCFFL